MAKLVIIVLHWIYIKNNVLICFSLKSILPEKLFLVWKHPQMAKIRVCELLFDVEK